MAKAIKQIDKTTSNLWEEQTEGLKDIIETVTDSREALLSTLEIIRELHEAGLLDIVKGVLKTRHKVGVLAIDELNQPDMHRMIKNAMAVFELFQDIDPEQLHKITDAVAGGLEKSANQLDENKQIGLWAMAKTLKDPDVNRSLTTLVSFLQGMGEEMKKKPAH
jgi:uncharacterized protein YjgD (DUF1641 family)